MARFDSEAAERSAEIDRRAERDAGRERRRRPTVETFWERRARIWRNVGRAFTPGEVDTTGGES